MVSLHYLIKKFSFSWKDRDVILLKCPERIISSLPDIIFHPWIFKSSPAAKTSFFAMFGWKAKTLKLYQRTMLSFIGYIKSKKML